jgi:hypothetical protein
MTAHELTGAAIYALISARPNHSRRQLLANAAIAASRVPS